MIKLNRRDFLQQSAGVAGAATFLPHWLHGQFTTNSSKGFSMGFQSWVLREELGKDFAGTLKMMAGLGYESMELCSPSGYAMAGFKALQSMTPAEIKDIMNGEGISCHSCHFLFPEFTRNGEERIDFASEMGLTQMVLSTFLLPKTATLDDWKKAAHTLNQFGEKAAKNGLQMVFHNHNMEFEKLDGQLIYDVLLQEFDPAIIKMQFQVWVASIGYNAADYFREHPGRFISAHLADWSGVAQEQVAVGKGTVDWKDFFEAGKVGGLENFFVEMDLSTLGESAAYIKNLI